MRPIEMFPVIRKPVLPERALLICGLDSVMPVVRSLAGALASEPGWVTAAAALDMPPCNPGADRSTEPVAGAGTDTGADPYVAPRPTSAGLQVTGGSHGPQHSGCSGHWLSNTGLQVVAGWMDQFTEQSGCTKVWICGFGILGSLATLYAAGNQPGDGDERVRGVACVGVEVPLADPGRPQAGEQQEELVLEAARRFAPRPFLVIHGLEDAVTLPDQARALASAAGQEASLRLLGGAGHDLHADPRVVALLIGWMDQNAL